MRNHWSDETVLDDETYAPALGHNPDSSVAAQYEDSVPPDSAYDPHDEESEPS